MSLAEQYSFILGVIIIAHRLPAVISPKFFRTVYNAFADRKPIVQLTGLVLLMFSGWGIYANVSDYQKPGWFIIGLSIFIFVKALGYLLYPRRTTLADRRANDMPDVMLSIISLAMILGGILVLSLAGLNI